MKLGVVAGILLLAFAGVSLVMLARSERAGTKFPDAQVTVCFFRGAQRCAECETIEAYAKEAVEKGFAEEMKAGRVAFVSINWEARGNRQFQDRFKLGISTVVLVRKDGRFRKFDELRYLLSDKAGFIDHLQQQVSNALKEGP
jgi:hypothetical protein